LLAIINPVVPHSEPGNPPARIGQVVNCVTFEST
jgi:hypothetical protein